MSDDNETNSGSVSFTAGESKLLISIMSNLQGDLNADWAAVATENNYKDASIAKTRWSQIRRKKIAPSPTKATGVTKTPAKKGRAAASPKGKGGKGKGKKKDEAVASEDDEDAADFDDALKVKTENAGEDVNVKVGETEAGAEGEDGAEEGEVEGHNEE